MPHSITIENDAIAMEVWPQFGGKVTSIVDKADGYELLFSYPMELPEGPRYDVSYSDIWHAGWDECLPAIAKSKYVGHPYDGITVPDHGELWGIPTTASPTKDGITCVWNGLRFGYRLTRKLSIEGSTILADYTLVNLAPFEFRFVWSLHALFAMTQPVRLDLTGSPLFRLSHDHLGTEVQMPFDWPLANPGEDLSRPFEAPARKGWKVFSTDPIESPFVIHYPTRKRTLTIAYEVEEAPSAYWGVWINTGGSSGHKHFSVEPTTGRFDQIDRAIRDTSAGRLPPMGHLGWQVRIKLGDAKPA